MSATKDREWIYIMETARRLQVHPKTARKILAVSSVRVQRLPGLPHRFNADDVSKLIESSIATSGAIGQGGAA